MACLGLFQITIEWFWMLEAISETGTGLDGWDGSLNASLMLRAPLKMRMNGAPELIIAFIFLSFLRHP